MLLTEPPRQRYRLPLFPLPVVLLPGAAMPLHIFEPRYRTMMADCLASDRRFGIVYHDWDQQGPFLSEEGRIGCVAGIRQHEKLDDGRYIAVVDGVERFRISDGIESESPYFEALVTPHPDAGADAGELEELRRSSIALFEAVVASLPETPEALPELSTDREVSFPLARTLRVEPGWHQQLLEIRDETRRLEVLIRVFQAVLGRAGSEGTG